MSRQFQSTRPRGRTRLLAIAAAGRVFSFNPRVLAGGRDSQADEAQRAYVFQSTRPRGRTRHLYFQLLLHQNCFNPRVLAGGRDLCVDHRLLMITVSIHASSREDATASAASLNSANAFQSTRPRGRTRRTTFKSYRADTCFNPRVLAGGRDPCW